MHKSREVVYYRTANGKEPAREWLLGNIDSVTLSIVQRRLGRAEAGNFGDCRSVGAGVWEMRIHYGPGLRVYYSLVSEKIVVLKIGTKRTQFADIQISMEYVNEIKERGNEKI